MDLAIMQPYLFPYIGYFQLINAADKFVVYDDVAFIKQGWINRNRILLNGTGHIFTVPLKNASSFTLIRETEINNNLYAQWQTKFMKTLVQAYKNAPCFGEVYSLVGDVLNGKYNTISELAGKSLTETSRFLGVDTEFSLTAAGYSNDDLKAEARVIDICKREKAVKYINPIGGTELYSKQDFERSGIQLNFIRTGNISYRQYGADFVPWLSVIDVMMFNPKEVVAVFLNDYELV